ncbi:GMC oxidoreductase [Luteimonas sp. e5]
MPVHGHEPYDCDYAVIGSGFGGSVAALRLAEKGYRVQVIEQGRRWNAQDMPHSSWNLRRWLWRPALGLRGFFGLRIFGHVAVLHGNAVGGGSIVYANTLLQPPDSVWHEGSWAGLADWPAIMPPHYARVRRMLGVEVNRRMAEADFRLQAMARELGLEAGFHATEVGVYFGAEGEAQGTPHADPYFAGEGPPRRSCIGCGACMVGCRHGAKNTLDLNYLYLAERRGVQVLAETRVDDLRPLGAEDGRDGYRLRLRPTFSPLAAGRELRCRGVVLAASSLGTQELLLRMRHKGRLPRLSPALGQRVRTNAESLIGVRFPGSEADLSRGIAIGSGLWLDAHTHVEATRYPAGSDAIGMIATLMARGRHRRLSWLQAMLSEVLRRPRHLWRLLKPRGFARESMILLCMQTLDGWLDMRLKRRWWWPFSLHLASHGARIPTFIPEANAFAEKLARRFGGQALTSLPEILLDIPLTAHCMGGACIGADATQGVCDANGRVHGYRHLLVCDGSLISANLGVNPSLTIAALAEHVMHHLPHADAADWHADTPGSPDAPN